MECENLALNMCPFMQVNVKHVTGFGAVDHWSDVLHGGEFQLVEYKVYERTLSREVFFRTVEINGSSIFTAML